jgi:hypothetical protein
MSHTNVTDMDQIAMLLGRRSGAPQAANVQSADRHSFFVMAYLAYRNTPEAYLYTYV